MKERLEAELKDWLGRVEEARVARGLALLRQAPAHEIAQASALVAECERHVRDAEDKLRALKRHEAIRKAEERHQEQARRQAEVERKAQLEELAKPCETGSTPEDMYSSAKRRFESDYHQLRRPDAKEVQLKRAHELIALARATGIGSAFADLQKFFKGFGNAPELHNIVPSR